MKDNSHLKRTLKKIVTFYHPDENSKTDMKKEILYNEIAKLLKNLLERLNAEQDPDSEDHE